MTNEYPQDSERSPDRLEVEPEPDAAGAAVEPEAESFATNVGEPPVEADSASAGEAESPEVLRDRWLRAAAELDNQRKRATRDRQAAVARERHRVLREFLPVLDSLERALAAQGGAENEWLAGLEAIHAQTMDILASFEVVAIDAATEPFDPKRHEAVAAANLPDLPEGRIVEVLQTGYATAGGDVLRPAKVIVVRHQPPAV